MVRVIAGRYSLEREIGRGGMGAVWLGRDELLNRPVALKKIGLVPGTDRPDSQRADREARLAARINDPHVTAVYDLIGEGAEQWLVMEYVEGRNLAEVVRQDGPLPPDQLAPLLIQAAGALAAAHGVGIVHRDVKPSNILVTPDGDVKLTDFGIARAESDASLTQTGLVTGSPAYLAPEVASGRPATEASDVWSLGATMFHALTGSPPYDVGENLLGALYRIVHEEPPRTESAGWLAPALTGAMTRDPARRWTMAQVRDFLLTGPTVTTVHPILARSTTRSPVRGAGRAPMTAIDRLDPAAAPLLLAPTPPSDDDLRAGPRRRALPWLVAAAVLAAIVVFGGLAYLLGSHRDHGSPESVPPTDSTTGTAATSTPPTTTPSPTAAAMKGFVDGYLRLADSDPQAAFQELTPAYAEGETRGLSGYLGFWNDVTILDIGAVTADPAALTATYTYTYERAGTQKTEQVTLRLVQDGRTYLIDGTA